MFSRNQLTALSCACLIALAAVTGCKEEDESTVNSTPSGSVSLASEYTDSRTITLTLNSEDAAKVVFSESSSFSDKQSKAYKTSLDFTLSDGDGGKTFYIKFVSSEGLESETESLSVTLDTTAPEDITIDMTSRLTAATTESITISGGSDTNFDHYEVQGGSYSDWTEVESNLTYDLTASAWNLLEVRAVDKAGNSSSTYEHYLYQGSTTPLNCESNLEAFDGGDGNITFPAAFSPYLVSLSSYSSTYCFLYGYTNIYLEAGTTFNVSANVTWYLGGNLYIQGTKASPVVVTSAQATPAKGDWKGLSIPSTGTASISYLKESYYTSNSFSGTTSITDSTFANFKTYGISGDADITLTYSSVTCPSQTESSVFVYNNTRAQQVSISYSALSNCYYGIYVTEMTGITLASSNLTSNTWSNFEVASASKSNHTVTGNYWSYTGSGASATTLGIWNLSSYSVTYSPYSTSSISGTGPR